MRYIDVPAKVLTGSVTAVNELDKWPYDDGSGDPYWAGGPTPRPYRWSLAASLAEQAHSSHRTRIQFTFTAMDVTVGDYIADLNTGITVKIIQITSKTESEIVCVVEDVLRYNTFRDPTRSGFGIFSAPTSIIVFEVNEDELPIIDPSPDVSPAFIGTLFSRFQNFEENKNFLLEKTAHGFVSDDLISADPATNSFVKTDSSHPYIIGSVSYNSLGPNAFMINPIQKVMDNYDYLIGDVGDVIYADPDDAGGMSLIGTVPVLIKLRNHSNSTVTGTVPSPSTIGGSTFQVNGILTLIDGSGSIDDFANAVNANTATHGIVATSIPVPAEASSIMGNFAYGEPVAFVGGALSATINGVNVNFTSTTYATAEPGYGSGYMVEEDMASDINAASIPNVTASTSLNMLTVTCSSGNITIVNGGGDANGKLFAGPDSVSGLPLTANASSDHLMKCEAVDARAINFLDVDGTAITDFGLISVENGSKGAGVIIEQGIRQAATYVVANIAARDALTPLPGDQAYVADKGNGEWAFFIYTLDDVWVEMANKDSSETDAQSVEVIITNATSSSGSIHTISEGRRVSFVTVTVTQAFNAPATLTVGDDSDNDRLMTVDQNDLTGTGDYSTTPSHTYSGAGDTTIKYYFDANGATVGSAIVAITYT